MDTGVAMDQFQLAWRRLSPIFFFLLGDGCECESRNDMGESRLRTRHGKALLPAAMRHRLTGQFVWYWFLFLFSSGCWRVWFGRREYDCTAAYSDMPCNDLCT